MRLLEKKNDTIGIGVGDGALMNHLTLQCLNGSISGATVTLSNGSVMISKGTLVIQGFRFVFSESEEVFNIANFTAASTDLYYVILRINYSSSNDDASYSVVCQLASATLNTDQIQNKEGSLYDYPICEFSKSGTTISNFRSLVSTIDTTINLKQAAEIHTCLSLVSNLETRVNNKIITSSVLENANQVAGDYLIYKKS